MIAVLAITYGVVHLPSPQRYAWRRVQGAIEDASGLRVETDRIGLRLWPARFVAEGIVVSHGPERVATVARLEAHWEWLALIGDTPRLERLAIDTLDLDVLKALAAAPESTADEDPKADPWVTAEIASLEVSDSRLISIADDLRLSAEQISLGANWIDGQVACRLGIGSVDASRDGRKLEVGPVELEITGNSQELNVEKLLIKGEWLDIEAEATALAEPPFETQIVHNTRLRPNTAIAWWDPVVARQVAIQGELVAEGRIDWAKNRSPVIALQHVGERLWLGGIAIDSLQVAPTADGQRCSVASTEWGEAVIDLKSQTISARADIDEFEVSSIAALMPQGLSDRIPLLSTVSGAMTGSISKTLALDTLSGDFNLEGRSGPFDIEARGEATGQDIVLHHLEARTDTAVLSAAGSLRGGESVAFVGTFNSKDLNRLAANIGSVVDLPQLSSGLGGSVDAKVVVSGRAEDTRYNIEAEWFEPIVKDLRVDSVRLVAFGDLNRATWSLETVAGEGTNLGAHGTADLNKKRVAGEWEVSSDDFGVALEAIGFDLPMSVAGNVLATGSFDVDEEVQIVAGSFHILDGRFDEWTVDAADLDFRADPSEVILQQANLKAYGSIASASGVIPIRDLNGQAMLDVEISSLHTANLPLELPSSLEGLIDASIALTGSPAQPAGEVTLDFTGGTETGLVANLSAAATLQDGVARILVREVRSAAGPFSATITAPLGSMPRPEFVWRDAPGGLIEIDLRGFGLKTAPLLSAMGRDELPAWASGDLVARVELDGESFEPSQGLIEINNLVISTEAEELHAESTLSVGLRGHELELQPLSLVGRETIVKAQGKVDLEARTVQGATEVVFSPSMTRLLPFPVLASGPISAQMAVWGSFDGPSGRIAIDQRGGHLRIRDPAIEISDLVLDAIVEKGRITIQDGSAVVNRGRVDLGGGWDRSSGQGLVAEIEDASFILPHGILTRWDGTLALEPASEDRFQLAGSLLLKAGLWERPFDIAAALRNDVGVAVAEDDPLDNVSLDLEIWGGGGVEIENNLGDFDLGWSVLRVGGTAAVPTVSGDLRINPGGSFMLGGSQVTVKKGTIRFTGDPSTDPFVEIVPVEDLGAHSGESSTLDTSLMAKRGLAQGLSGMLGFESRTLTPESIVVETEEDSSSNFTFGQRLNDYAALILTTDLSDPGQRTTMLQLANLPGLRGLSLQGYGKTENDETGARLIQRFKWGGSRDRADLARIKKIRLEGDWPRSKRKMRRATALTAGQPFDDFYLFVGAVRLEQELAALGYQQARVDGSIDGDELHPVLVYTCDLGPQHQVKWIGDRVSKRVRHDVAAMYVPPPLEAAAKETMRSAVLRHLRGKGYADATAKVSVSDSRVIVDVAKGKKRKFETPLVLGLSEAQTAEIISVIESPAEQAELLNEPERAQTIIRQTLKVRGYRDAEVSEFEVETLKGDKSRIRLTVDPGVAETVSEIELFGEDPLSFVDLDDFGLQVGDRLDRRRIDRAAAKVRNHYREEGYANAEVDVVTDEVGPHEWLVAYNLRPGELVQVTRVSVAGLRHLRESVVRKGIALEEGELFRADKLDETVVNLATFAPIDRVDVQVRPDGSRGNRVDLVIQEKARWTVNLGAGFSSEAGLQGTFGIGDQNLFGRGLSVNLRGRVDQRERLLLLYGAIPARPGGRVSFTSTLRYFKGDSKLDPDYLTDEERSISLGTTISLDPASTQTAPTVLKPYYRFSRIHSYEKIPDPFLPFETTTDVATLGVQFVRDTHDNLFDPRRGYLLSSDVGWSDEQIGSDLSTLSITGGFALALEPFKKATWLQSIRLGDARALNDSALDPEVRFFTGGQGSIRGFDRNSVGPTTWGDYGNLVPTGGGALFLLNEELRLSVWGPARLAVFADIGQVWESWSEAETEFAIGLGLGVRVSTPIGPIFVDVAWPVMNLGISSPGPKYYFGIGRPF
ncbi:MAG: BamA/TamA family outer membrane protein [bacterium]|nr:BamA/TamA family outer membrane protein [bacterium]